MKITKVIDMYETKATPQGMVRFLHCTPMEFKGRATCESIEEFVRGYLRSLMVGGVNYRPGQVIPNISRAQVRNQRTGAVVRWQAPMFWVI